MKKNLLFFLSVCISLASQAQCTPASAQKDLDINNVSARMLNGGDLWWDYTNSSHGLYEVRKGSGIYPIYAGAIWIGGYDQGNNLHGGMQCYRNGGNDFWPGPLDTLGGNITASTCTQYDKIWKINRFDVEMFKYEWAIGNVQNGTYVPPADFLSWPGDGNISLGQAAHLAPYVDVNNNGKYDPLTGGDYPKIKGDQMLWWIMNDKGNIHTETTCLAFGIEIHASAYAFTCPTLADSEQVLNYTTFYHYEIFNRNSVQYDSTFFGIWQDPDLGCATNDFIGCNPKDNYAYVYNGDSTDNSCSGELGYGNRPPICSTVFLNKPLSSFEYFTNGAAYPLNDPSTNVCKEWYNYLKHSWQDGTPVTFGGTGYDTIGGIDTAFCFLDFPYDTSGWSEVTVKDISGDRRFVMSSGPFTMLPGARIDYDFAVVWTRDTTLPFMSKAIFDKNLHDVQKVQAWFAKDSFPSCLNLNLGVDEANKNADGIFIYPNPSADGKFEINSLQFILKQIEIYNVFGEKIHASTINRKQETVNLSEAGSGIYFLKFTTEHGITVRKICKQ